MNNILNPAQVLLGLAVVGDADDRSMRNDPDNVYNLDTYVWVLYKLGATRKQGSK